MTAFTVGGFIIGPRLPSGSLSLDGVEIRRIQPKESFPRGRPRFPRAAFIDEDGASVHQFSVTPGEIAVHSSWILRFRVEADGDEEAMEKVERKLLPPVLAALEALGGEPYRVEFVRVIDEDRGVEMSPWTDWASGGSIEPEILAPDEETRLSEIVRVADGDSVAREAADLMRDSLLLQDVAGDHIRLLRAAVLAMFQAIERVVREVASRVPADVDVARQRTVVDHLRRALARQRAPAADVRAIRRAVAELDRVTGATTDRQILRAGEVLGVESQAVEVARGSLTFRNQRLGHPGRAVTPEELRGWLAPDRGRRAAVRFWLKYVDRVGREAKRGTG